MKKKQDKATIGIGRKSSGFVRLTAAVVLSALSFSLVAALCDWTWVGGCTTVDCQRIWCTKDAHINTIVYCQTQNSGTVCCQCKFDYYTCKGVLPCPNPSMVEKFKTEAQGADCQGAPTLQCTF